MVALVIRRPVLGHDHRCPHSDLRPVRYAAAADDVAVESTARAACDLGYRTIVVSDACTADSDQAHARAPDVLQKWFGETPTAEEVLTALK